MACVTVMHAFVFPLQITSGILGRSKARIRTKGCGTISTLSSCRIDPHMGHGPPLPPPAPPCMARGLYLSSHFTVPESGLNKSIISCSPRDSIIAGRSPFKESMFCSKSKRLNVSLKPWTLGWLASQRCRRLPPNWRTNTCSTGIYSENYEEV